MKFDEANKIVEAFDEDPKLEYWMPNSKVYEIIEGLRQEYAPTIEMTKSEQIKLLDYLDMSNLQEFMDAVTYEDDLYAILSFEDITQAWLHPETIKVVDE